MRQFVYIGNFEPEHSTENEIAKAIVDAGHAVLPIQENQDKGKAFINAGLAAVMQKDLGVTPVVLWTRTTWDWTRLGLSTKEAFDLQRQMLDLCKEAGIPTVGYHLDRWWGLDRERLLFEDPFFEVQILCTADGGHQEQWEQIGVDHVWFPPAISVFETGKGVVQSKYRADVAFVGNWLPGYHPEWPHRRKLIRFLQSLNTQYDVKFWPPAHAPAIRGKDLRDLYASTKIVVGDSCLVPKADGTPATHYCSDRVPETLGRNAFLIHPDVQGVTWGQHEASMYDSDVHLATYPLYDFEALRHKISRYLDDDDHRFEMATAGYRETTANHTYTVRVRQLVELLEERNLL